MLSRILLLSALLAPCYSEIVAQEKIIKYYSEDGEEVDAANAYYYVTGLSIKVEVAPRSYTLMTSQVNMTVFVDTVKSFYVSGNSLRSREWHDQEGKAQGPFLYYHPNGKVAVRGKYLDGDETGILYTFYPNGNVQAIRQYPAQAGVGFSTWPTQRYKLITYNDSTGSSLVKDGKGECDCYDRLSTGRLSQEKGNVVDGMRDSLWHVYRDGKLIRWELFRHGTFVRGENLQYKTPIPYTAFETMPEYNGGLEKMYRTMKENLKMPLSLKKSGTVYIVFVVEKDGHTTDHRVAQSLQEKADAEALRVVKLLKDWRPAVQGGELVKVKFALPVKFTVD